MNSIDVNNLTKKFGKFTSVDSISFTVGKGEIFGFLGANGAGKSTTIRMLCGILEPTSGNAEVAGFSIISNPEMVKRNIGYMSQKFSLYNDLTVSENINFFGGVYGLSGDFLNERKRWILNIAGLENREDMLTSNLSVGYKQRLALGTAVIHNPQIVFLDEPTGGVDPISRRKFWELINELSDKGTTVFVTTHYLDEAEFCNRITLIDSGKIIASGSPKELKSNYLSKTVIELDCTDVYKTVESLEKQNLFESVTIFGNSIHITLKGDKITDRELLELKKSEIRDLLKDADSPELTGIEEIVPSLEDVFINLLTKSPGNDQ